MPTGYPKNGKPHPCWFKKGSPNGMLGKQMTDETKKKIGFANKGNKPFLGRTHTDETKKKLSLLKKGNKNGCGKRKQPFTHEHRLNLAKARLGKKLEKTSGSNHWNWKGGISSETAVRVNSADWKNLRKKVYERDGWHCKTCGKHCGKDIQAHHIVPFRISQDDSMDNLITLCNVCHMKEEWKYYKRLKKESA
jgi:hypothetical protein